MAAPFPVIEVRQAFRTAEFPRYDNTVLDPQLVEKLTRRARVVSPHAYAMPIMPRSWDLLSGWLGILGAIAAAFGVLVSGAGLADNLIGDTPPDGWIVAGAAGAVGMVGVAMVIAGVRIRRIGRTRRTHPLTLDAGEVALVEKSLVLWPRTAEGLSAPLHSDPLRRAELDQLISELDVWPRRDAIEVWREARAVGIARVLADRIRRSPAYSAEALDTVRLDLDRLVADIDLRAYRILKARTQVTVATTTDTGLVGDAVDAAWGALIELIEQLAEYRRGLLEIEQLLAEAAALTHTPAVRELDVDDTTRQLLRDAAAAGFDTETVTARSGEPTDLRTDLAARIAFLRSLLDTTALPPLSASDRDPQA
ncbi:hypothetical protein ACFWM1_26395 [Nocardia sp. NPDC058379]|uniref:hypothetical protein n=1 Tax=unclassified Nocardia TaxID=2637762 RepID=UPI00364B5C75